MLRMPTWSPYPSQIWNPSTSRPLSVLDERSCVFGTGFVSPVDPIDVQAKRVFLGTRDLRIVACRGLHCQHPIMCWDDSWLLFCGGGTSTQTSCRKTQQTVLRLLCLPASVQSQSVCTIWNLKIQQREPTQCYYTRYYVYAYALVSLKCLELCRSIPLYMNLAIDRCFLLTEVVVGLFHCRNMSLYMKLNFKWTSTCLCM